MDDLLVGERTLAVEARMGEVTQDVVGGLVPLRLHLLVDVVLELDALLGDEELLLLREPERERQHPSVRPRLELRHVLEGEAQHPSDHRDRERHGEVGDDLDAVAVGEGVDEVLSQLGDLGPPRLQRLRGEERVDQSAVLPVHGRVRAQGDDTPPPLLLVDPLRLAVGDERRALPRAVGVQLGVAYDVLDVLVPGQHVHRQPGDLEHGRLVAQDLIRRVPVLLRGRVEEVDVFESGHRAARLPRVNDLFRMTVMRKRHPGRRHCCLVNVSKSK